LCTASGSGSPILRALVTAPAGHSEAPPYCIG
jgi:hypothetical protein